jgi:N-ethylmaleimide reductase
MLDGLSGITLDAETSKTFDFIVNKLNDYNLAYLHVSKPWTPSTSPYALDDVIGHYRQLYEGFFIANNGYDRDSAEQDIVSGKADAVAFGRLFIANPDLPYRFENNSEVAMPDVGTFYTAGPKGYIDYPSFQKNQ